jgi:iron complex transport system substrate-binding protein
VFLQTAFDSKNARDEALVNAGVPLVYNIDWMEKTPLARAEWIKFVGVLLNENERADSIFKVIERNYINLKKIADSIDYKPDVLVGGLYKDVWYMPGGQSFKARLLADAGTDYLWKNDSTEGSLALSFETVLEKQMNAPIWIEVQFKSKKELLSSDERYAYLDAFKIGAMYHNRKRTTETGGNDYWEMGLCRPDEILSDLIRIIHREYMPDGELKYYERVK